MTGVEPIDLRSVREKYNNLGRIWNDDDPWHLQISRMYYRKATKFITSITGPESVIVNIGCGDIQYECTSRIVNVDIAEKNLTHHHNPICASAERLPFKNSSIDAVVCVGSVINYCNAVEVCAEIHRILRADGRAIIEFESSESYEYFGRPEYSKSASIVDTTYANMPERIWLYKPSYMRSIVEGLGMQIRSVGYGHIASTFAFRITHNERVSSLFAALDRILSYSPLRRFSANVVFTCQKT